MHQQRVLIGAALLAQSFKAQSPIPQVGSSNPHHCIVFEHMQADDKTVDSEAYRVTGNAT